jgi:hypothetical protein
MAVLFMADAALGSHKVAGLSLIGQDPRLGRGERVGK